MRFADTFCLGDYIETRRPLESLNGNTAKFTKPFRDVLQFLAIQFPDASFGNFLLGQLSYHCEENLEQVSLSPRDLFCHTEVRYVFKNLRQSIVHFDLLREIVNKLNKTID